MSFAAIGGPKPPAMHRLLLLLTALLVAGSLLFIKWSAPEKEAPEGEEEHRAAFDEARTLYEFNMIKDPAKDRIPPGVFEAERAFVLNAPQKEAGRGGGNL